MKRQTTQKLAILNHLMNVKTHPTAEEVYEKVSTKIPSISLGTVYRNLNQMAESGKILKLEINKEFHFDADVTNHQHCICTKCNRIIDSYNDKINNYVLKKMDKNAFQPTSINIMLKGICKECGRN